MADDGSQIIQLLPVMRKEDKWQCRNFPREGATVPDVRPEPRALLDGIRSTRMRKSRRRAPRRFWVIIR